MSEFIRLGPSDIVEDRPFTDPKRSLEDTVALRRMLERLRHVLSRAEALPDIPPPAILFLQEPDGRAHRIAISRPDELLAAAQLFVIGFFGQKWPAADLTIFDGVDLELIHNFPLHPGVLSYSTLLLEDGNCGNLVILEGPEAIEQWRTNPKHAYAAGDLAPKYYANVRLHHYILQGPLMAGSGLVPLRTKYFDYHRGKAWLAIREAR